MSGLLRTTDAGTRPAAGHGALVAFTCLAIAGAGLVAASAYFEVVYHHPWPPASVAGALLLAAGLAVSFTHLGRKRRAARAATGAGRSPLSNEVIAATLALAGAAVAATLAMLGRPSTAAMVIAGMLNALFLVSIGLVYRVRGQRTWRGFSVLTPLTGGVAFGVTAVQSLSVRDGLYAGALLLIAIDALVFVQRWRELAALSVPEALLSGSGWRRRDTLLGARFFLLDVAPFFLLLGWRTPLATVIAAAGLVADRAGFYALALQHTTEHEVASIEDQLDRWGQSRF
jgi:DMSO reductase anchor subunit